MSEFVMFAVLCCKGNAKGQTWSIGKILDCRLEIADLSEHGAWGMEHGEDSRQRAAGRNQTSEIRSRRSENNV